MTLFRHSNCKKCVIKNTNIFLITQVCSRTFLIKRSFLNVRLPNVAYSYLDMFQNTKLNNKKQINAIDD